MQAFPDFAEINPPTPTYDEIAAEHVAIVSELDGASDTAGRLAALMRWDALRKRVDTWGAMVLLRFEQDTRNPEHKKAREYADELGPRLTSLEVEFKKKLLASPDRPALEAAIGKHAFALWEADVAAFDSRIEAQTARANKITAEYKELLASASFSYRGEKLNLSMLGKYLTDADRGVRLETNRMRWQFFADNAARLDAMFDELVKLRHGMARELGYANFIGLGYKRMKRIDYDQRDVENFRAQVREQLVPLAHALRQQQARRLGVDTLMLWDEGVLDARGNPAPKGDHDWMLERATEMFAALSPELDEFWRLLRGKHLIDLESREGKDGGGFCTSFPDVGLPFIFANFNGTKGDVEVFTHEVGHAFQGFRSRHKQPIDYLWPTMESCEIHSMSLEFLTWPHMEKFFGDDAERFRQIHLAGALTFIPYGVAVDHFQHLVYERPEATPAERNAIWLEMERTYLPWRRHGELPHTPGGGFWQSQRHIYNSPFYYIDYTLAQTCALQFWARSRRDFGRAMRDYVALCDRGGEAPFQELARSAGLVSPFSPGALGEVVGEARAVLGV